MNELAATSEIVLHTPSASNSRDWKPSLFCQSTCPHHHFLSWGVEGCVHHRQVLWDFDDGSTACFPAVMMSPRLSQVVTEHLNQSCSCGSQQHQPCCAATVFCLVWCIGQCSRAGDGGAVNLISKVALACLWISVSAVILSLSLVIYTAPQLRLALTKGQPGSEKCKMEWTAGASSSSYNHLVMNPHVPYGEGRTADLPGLQNAAALSSSELCHFGGRRAICTPLLHICACLI